MSAVNAPNAKTVMKNTVSEFKPGMASATTSPTQVEQLQRRFSEGGPFWPQDKQLQDTHEGGKKTQESSNHSTTTSLPDSPTLSDAENESLSSGDVVDECVTTTSAHPEQTSELAENGVPVACSPAWVPPSGLEDALSPSWSPWQYPVHYNADGQEAASFEPLPPAVMWEGQQEFEQYDWWWPQQCNGMSEEELFAAQSACNFGFVYDEHYSQNWMGDQLIPFDDSSMLYDAEYHAGTCSGTSEQWVSTETPQTVGDVPDSVTAKGSRPRWADQHDDQELEESGEIRSKFSHGISSSGETSANTTVMIRNLPSGFTRQMMIALIDSEGFAARYDFAYLPVDFSSGVSLGYGFINLISPADADEFSKHFSGFARWNSDSDAVCSVTWGEPYQGLAQHLERYRNSPVMHSSVPDEWKPILLVNGERVDFPAPTKRIKAPKVRNRLDAGLKALGSSNQ